VPLNGEVRVVRPDLTSDFDKTHTKRITEAIEKVVEFADREPALE